MTVWNNGLPFSDNGALQAMPRGDEVPATATRGGYGIAVDAVAQLAYIADAGLSVPAGAVIHGGLALTPDGALYVTESATGADYHCNGFRVRADGAVLIAAPAATDTYNGGWACALASGARAVGGGSDGGVTFAVDFHDLGGGEANLVPMLGGVSATFTRATTATTVGPTGLVVAVGSGVPRSYYDPTTLAYLGYLAEGARTNFAIQSIFPGTGATPTSWSQPTATGTSAETPSRFGSGDGSQAWVQSASAERPYLAQNTGGLSDGITYCFSIFLEATSGVAAQNLILVSSGTATPTVSFPICEANPSGGPAGVTVAGRLFVTFTIAAAGTVQIRCGVGTSGNSTGSATFSRPQLEAGAFPSTFIPTTTASVTRNADALTYPLSPWFSNAEGTIFAEAMTFESGTTSVTKVLVAATDLNGRCLYIPQGAAQTTMSTFDGTSAINKSGLTDISTDLRKRLSAWSASDSSYVVTGDGATVSSGSFDGTMGDGTGNIIVGNVSANAWYGPIRRVSYFNARLPNATLQALTA